jgi:SH3-like domain-containing protein
MKNTIKFSAAVLTLFLAAGAFAQAKFATVGVKEGNVRKCASAKCAVKFQVWKYTPLEMLKVSKDKNWVEVKDFEGFRGWIHKDLLSETPGVAAKTDANIRKEASTSAPIAWIVQKGYPLKVVKKQGAWYQVTDDDGTKGWISASVVWGFAVYTK